MLMRAKISQFGFLGAAAVSAAPLREAPTVLHGQLPLHEDHHGTAVEKGVTGKHWGGWFSAGVPAWKDHTTVFAPMAVGVQSEGAMPSEVLEAVMGTDASGTATVTAAHRWRGDVNRTGGERLEEIHLVTDDTSLAVADQRFGFSCSLWATKKGTDTYARKAFDTKNAGGASTMGCGVRGVLVDPTLSGKAFVSFRNNHTVDANGNYVPYDDANSTQVYSETVRAFGLDVAGNIDLANPTWEYTVNDTKNGWRGDGWYKRTYYANGVNAPVFWRETADSSTQAGILAVFGTKLRLLDVSTGKPVVGWENGIDACGITNPTLEAVPVVAGGADEIVLLAHGTTAAGQATLCRLERSGDAAKLTGTADTVTAISVTQRKGAKFAASRRTGDSKTVLVVVVGETPGWQDDPNAYDLHIYVGTPGDDMEARQKVTGVQDKIALDAGSLYFQNADGLQARSLTENKLVASLGGLCTQAPTLDAKRNRVYCFLPNKALQALDASTLKPVWTMPYEGKCDGPSYSHGLALLDDDYLCFIGAFAIWTRLDLEVPAPKITEAHFKVSITGTADQAAIDAIPTELATALRDDVDFAVAGIAAADLVPTLKEPKLDRDGKRTHWEVEFYVTGAHAQAAALTLMARGANTAFKTSAYGAEATSHTEVQSLYKGTKTVTIFAAPVNTPQDYTCAQYRGVLADALSKDIDGTTVATDDVVETACSLTISSRRATSGQYAFYFQGDAAKALTQHMVAEMANPTKGSALATAAGVDAAAVSVTKKQVKIPENVPDVTSSAAVVGASWIAVIVAAVTVIFV